MYETAHLRQLRAMLAQPVRNTGRGLRA